MGKHLVARAQVAEVFAVGIRAQHASKAVGIEDIVQLALQIDRRFLAHGVAFHAPDLQHVGRGNDAALARFGGVVGIGIHRILVAQHFRPVTDHGGIDVVLAALGRAELAADIGTDRFFKRLGFFRSHGSFPGWSNSGR